MLNSRRKEIELFFNEVLKDTKTPKETNGFYSNVVEDLIINYLKKSGRYNGLGFDFKISDIEILQEIVNEHQEKMNVLNGLK